MRHGRIMFALLLALSLLAGCSPNEAESGLQSVAQLNSKEYTVAVETGTIMEEETKKILPDAEYVFVDSALDGYLAVESGKADVYAGERAIFESAVSGKFSSLSILGEPVGEAGNTAVGISPNANIPDAEKLINTFLEEIKTDGTLENMLTRWLTEGDYTMPSIELPENPSMTIQIGTTGLLEPYSFYQEEELTGLDMELMKRFALWANAELEISVYDWEAIIPACATGKVDYVMSNLYVTQERSESVIFSDPYSTVETVIIAKESNLASAAAGGDQVPLETFDLTTLNGARMGVQVGSIYDDVILDVIESPEILYYKSRSDMVQALESGKIEGYLADRPTAIMICKENPNLTYWDHIINEDSYGFAFQKNAEGKALCDQMSEFLTMLREDGTLDQMEDKWLGDDETAKTMPDYSTLPATNGTIRYGIESVSVPFVYVRDGEVVGYEVELAIMFCEEYGYALQISDMEFAALIPAISAGKCDMISSCMSITPERQESVYFSIPNYQGGGTLMLRKETQEPKSSFWESLASSFEKNFIREDRWKLIVQGIGTTMLISVFAGVIGTMLGFALCMMRRTRFALISGIAKVYISVVQGTPVVVLLMILYYVVFGSSSMNAVWVAVLGFGLNFAAYVSEMMRTGIDAVDKGQVEAAYAIGFTKTSTFIKIVMPQAARHFLPVYRGEFISLVKMTSVAGYITIQDLTKMSDIIRSRTYEAFFPLIVTAAIYFLLSYLLAWLLTLIERHIDPKHRKRVIKSGKGSRMKNGNGGENNDYN